MGEALFNDDFVKKYSDLVQRAILNRVRKYGLFLSAEEAGDIRQEVFAYLWKSGKLDTIKNPESTPYWLAIVSGNAAMQYLRKRRRREPIKPVSLFAGTDKSKVMDFIASPELTPYEKMLKDEAAEKISCAIEALPLKEKLIANLLLLHDKKYGEIASILNMPGGTVSSYIKRLRAKLRKSLEELK